jgi:hypothetical protein
MGPPVSRSTGPLISRVGQPAIWVQGKLLFPPVLGEVSSRAAGQLGPTGLWFLFHQGC